MKGFFDFCGIAPADIFSFTKHLAYQKKSDFSDF
jgi:hypothetical protein